MFSNSVYFVFVLTSIFIFASVGATDRNLQVDFIVQGLAEQSWHHSEDQCLKDTLNILNNVKNHTLWAVWIWNSIQHPTGTFYGSKYSLGNYDQCLKPPPGTDKPVVHTQYCLVDVTLTELDGNKGRITNAFDVTDEFFKAKSRVGRSFNVLSWGTCLPASCNRHAVTKILKTIYLINPIASGEPNFTVDNCQVAGEKTVYSAQFYAFLIVMVTLVIAACSSTIYLNYNTEDTKLSRLAYSFSLGRNWSSLIRTSGDEIAVLNFTKSVNIVTVTVGHAFVFNLIGAVGNAADWDYQLIEKDFMLGNLFHHIDLPLLENFIIISGILTMKSLMEKRRNAVISLIQRYIRLIGPYAFLVFYVIAASKYTGDGPLWNKLAGIEQKSCEETWIWNLLMVNNYVDSDKICQVVSWYVPCDYHLAVMATALFCIWQWNRRAGKMVTILASFLALALPGIATYWKRLPGILAYDVEMLASPRENIVFTDTNIKTHHRAGPYLIGMATGYILTSFRTAKYRGLISRKWSYIGFAVTSIVCLRVWSSAGAWCLRDYDPWHSAVYAAFNRNIWAVATCMYIVIAEYGDIPKLQSLFAWPGFVIISRLGYGIYITHSLILQRNIFSQRSPIHFDMFAWIIGGAGVLLGAAIPALWLFLFVEAPLCNLTNLILAPRKKTTKKIDNGDISMNGDTIIHEMKIGKHL